MNLFKIGLELTCLDHLVYPVIDINDFHGQRDHQKAERKNNDKKHQEGHQQGGEERTFFKKTLKSFEQGIEDDR